VTEFLCDTSVWIALSIRNHAHHPPAQTWLGSVNASRSIFFCRDTQRSFLRLLTNSSLMNRYGLSAQTNAQAWSAYEAVIADTRIAFQPDEPESTERYWRSYSSRQSASPHVWMDAYLAAFARAGGYRLVTVDAGFRQYDGIDLLVISND
jgi:uncharacterized protein